MAGPLVVIAGGDGKNQDFARAARRVPRQGPARRADRPRRAARSRPRWPASAPTERASDMPAAVRAAQRRRAARRHRAAVAGLREPRHVPRLHASRRRVRRRRPEPGCMSAPAATVVLRALERPAAPPRARSVDHRHRGRAAADRPGHGRVGVDRHRREGDWRTRSTTSSASWSTCCSGCSRRRRAGRADAHLGRVLDLPARRRVRCCCCSC